MSISINEFLCFVELIDKEFETTWCLWYNFSIGIPHVMWILNDILSNIASHMPQLVVFSYGLPFFQRLYKDLLWLYVFLIYLENVSYHFVRVFGRALFVLIKTRHVLYRVKKNNTCSRSFKIVSPNFDRCLFSYLSHPFVDHRYIENDWDVPLNSILFRS